MKDETTVAEVELPKEEKPAEFDYNKLREDTVVPAIKKILASMSKHADDLIITPADTQETIANKYAEVDKEIMEIFSECNVNFFNMKEVFDRLGNMVMYLGNDIQREVSGHQDEIMSRIIGAKNPGDGKFDMNHATLPELFKAVLAVRSNTGGKVEDYFYTTPQEVPNDEKDPT